MVLCNLCSTYSITVVGDDVMVISGLLTPDIGVWRTPTGGGDICAKMLSDTHEVYSENIKRKLFQDLDHRIYSVII